MLSHLSSPSFTILRHGLVGWLGFGFYFLRQGFFCITLTLPGIHCVEQAALNSQRSICLCLLSARIKGVCHHLPGFIDCFLLLVMCIFLVKCILLPSLSFIVIMDMAERFVVERKVGWFFFLRYKIVPTVGKMGVTELLCKASMSTWVQFLRTTWKARHASTPSTEKWRQEDSCGSWLS